MSKAVVQTLLFVSFIFLLSSCNSDPTPDPSPSSNHSNIEGTLQESCINGNSKNCMELGNLFKKKHSHLKAEKYWEKACNLGNADGCYKIGYPGYDIIKEFLLYSCGSHDDYNGCDAMESYLYLSESTRRWYRKSCDLGKNLACIEYKKLEDFFGPMSIR
jgi:TPR repeat protein